MTAEEFMMIAGIPSSDDRNLADKCAGAARCITQFVDHEKLDDVKYRGQVHGYVYSVVGTTTDGREFAIGVDISEC